MGCAVFANGMSIACKVANGKTIAAMPDVCLSPPTPPAGPVPIPYPNTAMASDTTNGSKTVQIGGDEVMLKDQSTFKKSTGDEAATKSLGMGVVSHQIQGTVAFVAWSMDVKFESANVPRHLDMTLHNGASNPYDTPPWPYLDAMALPPAPDRCKLVPFKQGCPAPNTPHHCVPDHCFKTPGKTGTYYPGAVEHKDGLCVCVEGQTKSSPRGQPDGRIKRSDYGTDSEYIDALAEHGRIHAKFDKIESQLGKAGDPKHSAELGQLEDGAAKVISEVTGCDEDDLKEQLREYHQSRGLDSDTKLRADPTGRVANPPPYAQMGVSNQAEATGML